MKILMATDGSEYSRNAVEKGCEILLSDSSDILLKVISVYEEVSRSATEPFAVSAEFVYEMERLGREQATKFISEAESFIKVKYPNSYLELTGETVKGRAGRTIVEEAEAWEADIIVVGSHGRGFWGRTFLGSTSDTVVHHAPCSVLIVRQTAPVQNSADSADRAVNED